MKILYRLSIPGKGYYSAQLNKHIQRDNYLPLCYISINTFKYTIRRRVRQQLKMRAEETNSQVTLKAGINLTPLSKSTLDGQGLVAWSFPIPEVCGSNPVIGKIYIAHLLTVICTEKTKMKKKEAGMAQSFFKKYGWLKFSLAGLIGAASTAAATAEYLPTGCPRSVRCRTTSNSNNTNSSIRRKSVNTGNGCQGRRASSR